MSEPENPPFPQQRRRSFVEMLNPRASSSSTSNNNISPISTSPSSAVPASPNVPQRRGMSIALGLSGSGGSQSSPYTAFARQRRASISTSSASGSPEFRNSFDENAVIEEDDSLKATPNSPPSPSFARRLSFGAQALRDVKQTPGTSSGRRTSTSLFTLSEDSDRAPPPASSSTRSPGSAKAAGEGFNWSDALRDRNKRAPSISTANPFSHNRTRSFNTPTTTPVEPPQEMPKAAPAVPPAQRLKKPDHLGERMLRGEFMMD